MTRTKNALIDMDGVLVSGRAMIPGADGFLERLRVRGAECLVLTSNPLYAPGDLAHRLKTVGLDIPSERIVNSAADIEPQGLDCPASQVRHAGRRCACVSHCDARFRSTARGEPS